MNILWAPFLIILSMDTLSIFGAIYLSSIRSYDCVLVDTVATECLQIDREYDTHYDYIVNCTMNINSNMVVVESHCSTYDTYCGDCINRYKINKTYVCWDLVVDSQEDHHYTFSWNNYDSYPSLYVTLIPVSVVLSIFLTINGILIYKSEDEI